MQKMPKTAMCGYCGQDKVKGQLVPAPNGGAKCRDWFECARFREAMLREQIPVVQRVVDASNAYGAVSVSGLGSVGRGGTGFGPSLSTSSSPIAYRRV